MDRYGYVNQHYQGRAMAGQTRVVVAKGDCGCSFGGDRYKPVNMSASCGRPQKVNGNGNANGNGNGKPVIIYEQPQPTSRDVKKMVFSHDGRDWTTGVCGCFEHCSSCTWYHNSVLFSRFVTFSAQTFLWYINLLPLVCVFLHVSTFLSASARIDRGLGRLNPLSSLERPASCAKFQPPRVAATP